MSTRTVSFFLVSSQKISLKVLLSVGRRAPCSKKKPHPLWRTQFWFSKTSDNQYIQICQLEKDTQKGHRKFVFFFVRSLHSEADKEHSMDHSRPCVAGVGRGGVGVVLSVISVCHDFGRGCGRLLFLLLLGWLAVCGCGAPP